jgi:hypothetical protein
MAILPVMVVELTKKSNFCSWKELILVNFHYQQTINDDILEEKPYFLFEQNADYKTL